MVNYQEARVKLINAQFNKLKSAAENKTRAIWRIATWIISKNKTNN